MLSHALLQISYLIVDDMHAEHPELIKDQYWDQQDFDLPYTAESLNHRDEIHVGSAMGMRSVQFCLL